MTRTTLYLNLRGMNLVLDFSDNGGLWLLSQYFKKCNSHTLCCSGSRAPFSFWTMPSRWKGLVGAGRRRENKGEDTICVTESSLSVCLRAEYPLQQTGEVRSNHFTPINQSWVRERTGYELLVRELRVYLSQKKKIIARKKVKVKKGQCLSRKNGA